MLNTMLAATHLLEGALLLCAGAAAAAALLVVLQEGQRLGEVRGDAHHLRGGEGRGKPWGRYRTAAFKATRLLGPS